MKYDYLIVGSGLFGTIFANLANIMMTTYFSYYKEKLTFREITFKPRQGGVNSINIPKIVKIGWNALSDFRVFKRGMKKNEFK